jgi:putative transposase
VIFSNHYHFIVMATPASKPLQEFVQRLHAVTALEINAADGTPRRKVWFQYWDTQLTFEKSYLARLNYVLQNPVRHGLVGEACDYPWGSASWFERTADKSFVGEVHSFKTDTVNVIDQFEVEFGE